VAAGVPTPAPVAAADDTPAPVILEPEHAEEAAPLEEAGEPENAAAEAVTPPKEAEEVVNAPAPSEAVAEVAKGEEAPSAAGGEVVGAEAEAPMASLAEVLAGAGFEEAEKPHDTEAELRIATEEFIALRDQLRASYKQGLTLRGDEEFEGAHPGFQMPSMLLRRPGAPDHQVQEQKRALSAELRQTDVTSHDVKMWEANQAEDAATDAFLEGSTTAMGGAGAAPQKQTKEELLQKVAGKGALKEPVYVEEERDGEVVRRALTTEKEVHDYLTLSFEKPLDALAGMSKFKAANDKALEAKYAGMPIGTILKQTTGAPSAAERNATSAENNGEEIVERLVLKLGAHGKPEGALAERPPWDLKRDASRHLPAAKLEDPEEAPDAEDTLLPVPPTDLTLRRAAIQKVEIVDVGNEAKNLKEKLWDRLCADPIPNRVVDFSKAAVVTVRDFFLDTTGNLIYKAIPFAIAALHLPFFKEYTEGEPLMQP